MTRVPEVAARTSTGSGPLALGLPATSDLGSTTRREHLALFPDTATSDVPCASSIPPRGGRAERSKAPHPDTAVWFWIETTVRPVPPRQPSLPPLADGVISVRELARLTGRHERAVLQAVRSGRLRRADVPRGYGVCVIASAADVLAWQFTSFAAVLEAARIDRPGLPSDSNGWRTIQAVATATGLCYATACRRLSAASLPELTWDAGTPFRLQRRVYLPAGEEHRLTTGAVEQRIIRSHPAKGSRRRGREGTAAPSSAIGGEGPKA
jgi:hypothetical protein